MKNFISRAFYGLLLLIGAVLTFTIIGAIIGVPLIMFSWKKVKLLTAYKIFGEEVKFSKVFISDEGSKGSFTRETDMYLLYQRGKGTEMFTTYEVERNSDLRLLRDVTAAQNVNTRVVLNNNEFNKKLSEKGDIKFA